MSGSSRGVALVAAAGIAFGCGNPATASIASCENEAPNRVSEGCRARDDVRAYVQAAKNAIAEAWQRPAEIGSGRHVVKMRFRIATDGRIHAVCAIEGAASPAAPAALDAFARVGRVAKPSTDVAACIDRRDLTATFDLLVDRDDR